ncbi:MAG: energy-coupling factor transporter transmembrane protein EcfT [Clostridia bacterium]|nr:energy-coupling factor transporter transmembrane protein EcfT [Clostridia bacterium]
MFARLFYQEKGFFLQSLHPVTILIYLGVLFALALIFTNPLYLLGMLLVITLSIWSVEGLESLAVYLKIGLGMAVAVVIINSLTAHLGVTVIWRGPELPLFGRISICLEAICYGAMMSVRLLAIMAIFCLYNLIMHPDKILAILARFAFKSALVISLATRMFPALLKQLDNIREVQSLRGVDFNRGSLVDKLRHYLSLVEILLLTSLEDAFEIAEAMQARAFGSGKRSVYRRDFFRPRDYICLAASFAALILAAWGQAKGYSTFAYYPRLDHLIKGPATLVILFLLILSLSVPVLLSWGWQHCLYIKSRI